jgi:single-strand DNA-binding protein
MINEAYISVAGYVATQPTFGSTRSGIRTMKMRLAWTPRRRDGATGEWVDQATSFASVECYRKLAEYAGSCLRKGDPIVVTGTVRIREYDGADGIKRTAVEVTASSIGHDMSRGTTTFTRRQSSAMTAAEFELAKNAGAGNGSDGSRDPADPADGLPADGQGADGQAADGQAAEGQAAEGRTADDVAAELAVADEDFDSDVLDSDEAAEAEAIPA